MFGNFLSSRSNSGRDGHSESRRKHERRASDQCVSMIAGRVYPIIDWSLGGILIAADDRLFGLKEEMDVTLKFHMRNNILEVPHKARVIRKNNNRIAFEFEPLSRQIRDRFQTILDDAVVREFADSQLV